MMYHAYCKCYDRPTVFMIYIYATHQYDVDIAYSSVRGTKILQIRDSECSLNWASMPDIELKFQCSQSERFLSGTLSGNMLLIIV